MSKPVDILFADGISAAGGTVAEAVAAMMEGRQPLSVPRHFNFKGLKLGVIHDLEPDGDCDSRAYALLRRICRRLPAFPKAETRLYLATTVGAIDLLEKAPVGEKPDCTGLLLQYAKQLTGIEEAVLVAAACASGQTAAAMAMRALRNGTCKYALVIGIDICSEFVTGGFASLRAYAADLPHPYDAERDGLCLGEGCGALLLTVDGGNGVGQIVEALETCDASHITAPDLTGASLKNVISRTMDEAGVRAEEIAAVIGHGTGTVFNDSSEINALNMAFEKPLPLLSIKGCTGHTLGATGVLQIAYALEFMRRGVLPPQAGLRNPADGIEKFVSREPQPLISNTILSLNVGFGGLNSAVIVRGGVLHSDAVAKSVGRLAIRAVAQIKPTPKGLIATYSAKFCAAAFSPSGESAIEAADLPELKRIITESDGFVKADLADFRRAADNVRLSQLCAILCASALGGEWSPGGTAIIGHDGSGCASNNRAFWDDFTSHGRDSGRATLFVPTLPSIPVCEAAIALNIQGPVRYIATETPSMLEEHLLNTFSGDETLRQILTVEIFDDMAEAKLYSLVNGD